MKRIVCLIFITAASFLAGFESNLNASPYDLTLVGQVKWCGGLERLPISLTRIFKNELAINLISTPGHYDFSEVPLDEQAILRNPDKTAGKVAILFDIVWHTKYTPAHYVPEGSLIKIAYSMFEASAIPPQWVNILNNKFDLVVVPDEFCRGAYLNCGVQIPIFVVPLGIDVDDFLKEPVQSSPSKPFVFGSSASFLPRKNHKLLIEAFHAEFGTTPSVRLKIHGRNGSPKDLQKKIKNLNRPRNIELIATPFSVGQYTDFLKSLDCYVLLSKGEGFSLTPREALALCKPCIISDNTAHHALAETGFVYPVISNIKEPAFYQNLNQIVGHNFNCTVSNVRIALREVYTNYEKYQAKAQKARKWVEQFLWKNMKPRFLNLIKPKKVILADENVVTNDFLMTSSEKLYHKYLLLHQ